MFPGRNTHLTTRSVQQIVSKAGNKAGLKKHIHSHMFRHSFTTHLLRRDVDITSVQTLLGHFNPESWLFLFNKSFKD